MEQIKVLIVDDQTLMRDGLKTILDLECDIEVIGTACDGLEGYEKVKDLKPDVVLMDIRMPNLNGVEATKMIKRDFLDVVVVILTTFDDDDYIIEALCNGASGYLLKDMHGDKLIQSVRDAFDGNMMLPGNIAIKIADKIKNNEVKGNDSKLDYDLTEREKEISKLIINGYSNKKISETLYISIGTVKNYISNIYSKLGVSNRASAIIYLSKIEL